MTPNGISYTFFKFPNTKIVTFENIIVGFEKKLVYCTSPKKLKTNIECTSPGVNFCVNYVLLAIIMWQCNFINFSKYTRLVGDADSGRGGGGGECACVRSEHIINFSVNIKLLSPKDFNSNNKFNFKLKHIITQK